MNRDKYITFYPSIGVGDIKFSFNEDDIVETLGDADEIDEDIIDDSESVVSISYYNFGIDCFVEYFDEECILSIHSDDIILDGLNLASVDKDQVIEHVKKHHEKNNIEFIHDKIFENDSDEESHYFDNIGLTIWYDNDGLTDICCQHPDDM